MATRITVANSKIRNIVVALDDSKHSQKALDHAIYLARQSQAKLSGIYVIPLFSVNYTKPASKFAKWFVDSGRKVLADAKTKSAQNGILFYENMANGNEGFTVVSFAKKKKADLIVIGSRGRSNVKEFFLGSVSHYVAHKSSIPVLIVK